MTDSRAELENTFIPVDLSSLLLLVDTVFPPQLTAGYLITRVSSAVFAGNKQRILGILGRRSESLLYVYRFLSWSFNIFWLWMGPQHQNSERTISGNRPITRNIQTSSAKLCKAPLVEK